MSCASPFTTACRVIVERENYERSLVGPPSRSFVSFGRAPSVGAAETVHAVNTLWQSMQA